MNSTRKIALKRQVNLIIYYFAFLIVVVGCQSQPNKPTLESGPDERIEIRNTQTPTSRPQNPSELVEIRNTPSSTPEPTSARFAVIGDFGYAGQELEDVANLIKSWEPDFIITTGDNNYDNGGSDTIDQNIGQYFHEYIGTYIGSYGAGASQNRFFPTLGNHDWRRIECSLDSCSGPYLDYFTLPGNERYYDFVWGPVHFFILDSDVKEPDGINSSSRQAMWLHNLLQTSESPWKLVVLHHAPYSSSSNHGSIKPLQWPYNEWGASAVMSGHDHTYERLLIDGLPYFVNGLGGRSKYGLGTPLPGSQISYNDDFGAMLVEANLTKITFQFITRDGEIIDSYSIENGVEK